MSRQTQKRKIHGPNKIVVGYIHADWCGHCTALKPVWAQMKKIIPMHLVVYEDINSNHQDARIAKLNKTYGVNMGTPQGYPYIFKIVDGKIHEYSGERSAQKMADWFTGKAKHAGADVGTGDGTVASSHSSFGKGLFRGGIKHKRARRHTVGKRNCGSRSNKRRTQKSFFSQFF